MLQIRRDDSIMDNTLILIALIGLVAFGWLIATWYFADALPVLGPAAPGRVTFKQVVQGALRDIRDVLKLDIAARWLRRNATALAVFLSGLLSMADPTLRSAILTATFHGLPVGALALLIVTWLATLKSDQRDPYPRPQGA